MVLSDSDEDEYDDDEEATGQDAATGDEDADLLGRVTVCLKVAPNAHLNSQNLWQMLSKRRNSVK